MFHNTIYRNIAKNYFTKKGLVKLGTNLEIVQISTMCENSANKWDRVCLTKAYFDPAFIPPQENLWSELPHECRMIIRNFDRKHSFAVRIQRHYRKVRYAPGTAPPYRKIKYSSRYETLPSGYRRCVWNYTFQRAIIHWPKHNWECASIVKTGNPKVKYEAVLSGDYTTPETGRHIYYYDLKKRAARNFGYLVAVPQDPQHVLLIKPW